MPANANAARQAVANRAETPVVAGKTLREELISRQKFLEATLPKVVNAERFIRMVLTTVRLNPQLQNCSPMSIVTGAVLSALYGLEIGPMGHAYLVPFNNGRTNTLEAQFILGYKGMIDLARRSGQVPVIQAREVCEGDEFDYEFGFEPWLKHKPALRDRGDAYAYWGYARLASGDVVPHLMSLDEVNRYRARSKAADKGPWVTDYDAMARKTVIRRMWPWLPQSVEAREASMLDERVIPALELPTGDVKVDRDEIAEKVIEAQAVDADFVPPSGGDDEAQGDPSRPADEPAPAGQSEGDADR